LFVSAFISVVPFIGAVAGAFCIGVVVLVQFIVVVLAVPLTPGVADVVVPVPVGFVWVTGVPGTVAPVPLGVVEDVVVVPLVVVDVVVVPFVVTVAFGLVALALPVVAEVPGGQFGMLVVVVDLVVVGVVVVVLVFVFVLVVVCAKAGTAILTTSPATEARPRIARELMRRC
jgi:hypothetical protein